MRYTRLILLTTLVIIALTSCSKEARVMSCGKIEYVSKFEIEKDLPVGEELDKAYDLNACVGVKNYDSIAIFYYHSGDYFWKVYDLKRNKLLACLFPHGHSSDEAVNIIVPQTIYEYNGELFVQCTDADKLEFEIINLSQSIAAGKAVISYKKRFKLDNFLLEAGMFSDSTFIVYAASENMIKREVCKGDSVYANKWMEPLNKETDDMNAVSAIHKINYTNGRVAEGMLYLNQMSLYSTSGNFAKTLCFGKQLTDVTKVERTNRDNRTHYFNSITAYNDYLVATYVDARRSDYEKGNAQSSVMFITWDGKPKARYHVNYVVDGAMVCGQYLYLLSTHGSAEHLYKVRIQKALL